MAAGRQFSFFLDGEAAQALLAMVEDTGKARNAVIAEAVKGVLEEEGYLESKPVIRRRKRRTL